MSTKLSLSTISCALADDEESLLERVQRIMAEGREREQAKLAQEWADHRAAHVVSRRVGAESAAPKPALHGAEDFLDELWQETRLKHPEWTAGYGERRPTNHATDRAGTDVPSLPAPLVLQASPTAWESDPLRSLTAYDTFVASGSMAPSEVMPTTDRGTTYSVDQTWVKPYAEAHRDLVSLYLCFYNFSESFLSGRMSTTTNITNLVISSTIDRIDREYIYLDRDRYLHYLLINELSSGQMLRPYPGKRVRSSLNFNSSEKQATWATVQDRANWTCKLVRDTRNGSSFFTRFTTSKQIDRIAADLRGVFIRVKQEERAAKIDQIANSFLIDTRGKLGRPAAWDGFPQKMESGATAYMRLEDGEWVLWAENGSPHRPQVGKNQFGHQPNRKE